MRVGAPPAHGRLSRNPLFRSNCPFPIVDGNVDVHVDVDGSLTICIWPPNTWQVVRLR